MDTRRKILAAVVILLLGGFVFERFLWDPWTTAMKEAEDDRRLAQRNLSVAKDKARQEPEISKEWKALKDKLGAVKSEEASNRLATFVDQLIRKHDLKKSSLSPETPVPVTGNARFREHPLAFSFQCSWESFVKLLVDLYSAEEFARIQRLSVQSHYLTEKENYLDISMRLSTVSAVPTGSAR
jgi:hypothetical protein